ncbi:MAG: DnaA/Hda family protein, partial [Gammaproteobacteria bacterium]|nr:DnaA/Hda family protein [Gammaproteobacteria bacterium]
MAQLPLELRLDRHASFASFVAGDNRPAVEHVRAVALGERREIVWLWGAPSTGKTHLLTAACHAAGEQGRRAMYVALEPEREPGLLAGHRDVDLLTLDDAARVAGRDGWEQALFGAFDSGLQRGGLIVGADRPPRECGFALADLASR